MKLSQILALVSLMGVVTALPVASRMLPEHIHQTLSFVQHWTNALNS